MNERTERVPIDERVKELEGEGLSKSEIVLILYDEGYPTQEIMKRGLPLKALKRRKTENEERDVMGAMRGRVRGEGYLDELKNMIRAQISRSRELTELCSNIGLGTLLAALRKSGISIDGFRSIAMNEGTLKDALGKAAETAFKALEYYNSEQIEKLEKERDEARVYASFMESRFEELATGLDPKMRLERMIHTYLLSGNVDANVLTALVDKWLSTELTGLKMKVMAT